MVNHKSRMSELSFHFLRGDAYNSLFFASKEMKDRKLQKMPIEIHSPTPPRGIVVHPRLFPSPLSKFWLSSGRAKVVLPWRCSLTGVWEVESWTRDGVSRGGWCAKNAPASRFYVKCWRNSSSFRILKLSKGSISFFILVYIIEKCLIHLLWKFLALRVFSS